MPRKKSVKPDMTPPPAAAKSVTRPPGATGGLPASASTPAARPSPLVDTRVIYCGDNLVQLKKLPDASIDLIYIDPPFNSNRNYEVFWGETREKRAFEDRHASTQAYIEFMRPRCLELARVLKKTGSFYYHCDMHASHYVKVMLDQIFGENSFRNELIWRRTSAPEGKRLTRPREIASIFQSRVQGEDLSPGFGLRQKHRFSYGGISVERRFNVAEISSRDMVLLLLGLSPTGITDQGMGGITRLQKLLYLLEQQENIKPAGNKFEFAAYKAGPFSSKLYDDLEFLENLGLVESEVVSEATEAEADEVDQLTFDDLMSDGQSLPEDSVRAADAHEERRFGLTKKGIAKVDELLQEKGFKPVVEGIRKVKSRFGRYSLSDLLYYVYTKYPEMTVESEIKDSVLRRQHRS